MYTVRDLTSHLIYILRRDGFEGVKPVFLDKVVFCALTHAYKAGHDIKYDILFEKTRYGAMSSDIRYRTKTNYMSNVDVEEGKCTPEFENDEVLDETFIQILKLNEDNSMTLPQMIKNSAPYLRDKENIKISEEKSHHIFPYWTKAEIIEITDPENKKEIDSRIPIDKDQYAVMMKYMELSTNNKIQQPFSYRDLTTLHFMPRHLIKSIEVNGFYLKEGKNGY